MMALSSEQLKILLIGANLLTPDKFDEALRGSEQEGSPMEIYLVQNGYIPDNHLGQMIANYLNVNFVDLSKELIDQAPQKLIPEPVARKRQAIAFKQDAKMLHLGTSNPSDHEFISLLKKSTGKDIKVYYATPLSVNEALKNYKADVNIRATELIKILQTKNKAGSQQNENALIELVNIILESAYDRRASDIHIEPLKKKVLLRLRIDGILHEVLNYPKQFHDNIVSRIKILSKLSIDEHAAAQDGRFSYVNGSTSFDIRVSILPTTNGENVVMRLLAESSRQLYVDTLGLSPPDLNKLKRASKRPYGMILAVGPTGAGKTTTLYSVLQILNRPEVNIMTIEDPVEYEIEEVRQTQVNEKKKITFANGLRSIVRQDPNIIMVGEIRDEETANIAVNAAMTGHLVLSTLHANDAATTFPRLFDMKVEPFLVSSSVNLIISQRLVRNICEKCRESYFCDAATEALDAEPEIKELIKKASGKEDLAKIRVYHGKGCKACADTGYRGRTGIFEILEMNDEIRTLITQKAASDVIYDKAAETGMTSMLQDGISKVLQGMTTIEEVIRATKS